MPTHGEPWHHDLGPPLTYPGRERAKPLECRAATAHFVVVVCVVFCVLCLLAYFFSANQLVEIDLDTEQISKLCATVNKKPPQKHPDIIRCVQGWNDSFKLHRTSH